MNAWFVVLGIVSAALFGITMPIGTLLLRELSQFQLAGLLYLGAGIAMFPFVILGGGTGELRVALAQSRARRDHLDVPGRVGVGGALLAGVLVTMGEGSAGVIPALLVAGACVCWGLDNSLTALIGALTPQETTFFKGMIAGTVNTVIGVLVVKSFPAGSIILAALGLGAICCGGSIALFITAAQQVGAARSQVLFAAGPFFGMLVAVVALGERLNGMQGVAILVLVVSIALMLRARHAHGHRHESVAHLHAHRHDGLHHTHRHPDAVPVAGHSHEHVHDAVEHDHVHVPDLHHRHSHRNHRT